MPDSAGVRDRGNGFAMRLRLRRNLIDLRSRAHARCCASSTYSRGRGWRAQARFDLPPQPAPPGRCCAPSASPRASRVLASGLRARRSVSRVLSRPCGRGRSSIYGGGCPPSLAADPGAERRRSRRTCARLLPYLALLQVELARFTPARGCPLPARLCGAGPRLSADGSYPLPCVAELGLSSCQ